jgi:hypothetical protein
MQICTGKPAGTFCSRQDLGWERWDWVLCWALAAFQCWNQCVRKCCRSQNPAVCPKAKRVIYIHMAGAPSQLELFDYKPELVKYHGQDCPAEFLEGKKFAFIQGVPKMLGPQGKFAQYGQSGAWMSDYVPYLQTVADEITFHESNAYGPV